MSYIYMGQAPAPTDASAAAAPVITTPATPDASLVPSPTPPSAPGPGTPGQGRHKGGRGGMGGGGMGGMMGGAPMKFALPAGAFFLGALLGYSMGKQHSS